MAVLETALPLSRFEFVIEGDRRVSLLQALRELWAFRHTVSSAWARRSVRTALPTCPRSRPSRAASPAR